jgi:hypothetical protein
MVVVPTGAGFMLFAGPTWESYHVHGNSDYSFAAVFVSANCGTLHRTLVDSHIYILSPKKFKEMI